jgi:hypothetical protein
MLPVSPQTNRPDRGTIKWIGGRAVGVEEVGWHLLSISHSCRPLEYVTNFSVDIPQSSLNNFLPSQVDQQGNEGGEGSSEGRGSSC